MINTIYIVFLAASVIGFIVPLFMLFRIHWVFNKRTEILKNIGMSLNDRHSLYERLPSFNVMVRRWWIWDVNKFLSDKEMEDGENSTGAR